MRTERAADAMAPTTGRCRVSDVGVLLVGIAIAVGIVGVVVPVLPGALLVWAAIAVWAFAVGSATAWAVLAVVSVVIGGAQVIKCRCPVGSCATPAFRDARSSWVWCSLASASSSSLWSGSSSAFRSASTSRNVGARAACPRVALDSEGSSRNRSLDSHRTVSHRTRRRRVAGDVLV